MSRDSASTHLVPWLPWGSDTDRVAVVRPEVLVAGTWTEIEVAITVQGRELRAGEGLCLGVPFGFPPPRVEDERAEAYTTVSGPESAKLSLSRMDRREHFVRIQVEGRGLEPGEQIIVRYGDRRGGSPGVRVPRQAMRGMLLPCFRDTEPPALLRGSPRVTVGPSPLAGLRAHLPGTARPGERVRLRVVAQDGHGNCPEVSCGVRVVNGGAASGLPQEVALERGRGEAELTAPPSGVVRIAVREPQTRAEGLSNAMEVSEEAERLYFGDIHAHTELSYDAGGEIGEMYQYARDVAGLDFAAAADHQTAISGLRAGCGHAGGIPGVTFETMPERWRATCDAAVRFHEPRRFVTFAGFEFAPHEFPGHRNVYWCDDNPEMLQARGSVEEWLRSKPLARLTRGRRVLVVPHHPPIMWAAGVRDGGGLVYGDLPDALQPVVEVCSKHGTSERLNNERPLRGQCTGSFVTDFLEAGHRFGFIGGSDTHLANPGSPLREGPYATLRFRAGLAAVWARELTREALCEALCARRCYATTGPKLGLRFWVGDLFMGQEDEVRRPRLVRVEAHGESPIILVEIVKNGTVIARWDPHRPRLDVTFEHEDETRSERDTDYYYARVRQHDGEWAWSSPVWVSGG